MINKHSLRRTHNGFTKTGVIFAFCLVLILLACATWFILNQNIIARHAKYEFIPDETMVGTIIMRDFENQKAHTKSEREALINKIIASIEPDYFNAMEAGLEVVRQDVDENNEPYYYYIDNNGHDHYTGPLGKVRSGKLSLEEMLLNQGRDAREIWVQSVVGEDLNTPLSWMGTKMPDAGKKWGNEDHIYIRIWELRPECLKESGERYLKECLEHSVNKARGVDAFTISFDVRLWLWKGYEENEGSAKGQAGDRPHPIEQID